MNLDFEPADTPQWFCAVGIRKQGIVGPKLSLTLTYSPIVGQDLA